MKKSLFSAVFLLVTSMSFANEVKDKSSTAVDDGAVASSKKTVETLTTIKNDEDICSVSCYAEIYYLGELRTTVFSSATAGDCITAQTDCFQKAQKKADAYIAAAE
ncbi:hypothetical protein IWX83_000122 [Flavobacterium sp. CG_9.1]|uniref:Uncharacterized protein n=1 Tax=Flavobacterium xanthum TaxID=69322 RepID=A0A1M7L614_9FLAO|nr:MULTISPECIES: hypothetical protein [Flavobacterium]MBG6060359.1 hypothetical protein [Flavobacterium sp. CG_9.1]SHM72783.1 hypothetical protein SAMN05443669_10624 [Flavobacterium xanthum]